MLRGFLVLSILLVGLPAVGAGQTVVLPVLVVEDGNDEVMGPVVGFATRGGYPIIRLLDPVLSHPIFLQVNDTETLEGGNNQTWFADDGCTGAAYHKTTLTNTDAGVASLVGFSYSVAVVSNVQWLFRSDLSEGGVLPLHRFAPRSTRSPLRDHPIRGPV